MVVLQDLTVIQWLCVSLLIGISGVQSARPVSESDNINRMKEVQDFYQKLENHLVRDNTTLFLLKSRLFFQLPSDSFVDAFEFHVCLSVGDNPVTNCSVADALWQPGDFNRSTEGSHYCWDFQWSNSAILGSLTIDLLTAFENVFVQEIYRNIVGTPSLKHQNLALLFHLQSPPCLSETDIQDVLVEILSWIKAYTRSSGRPSSWDKRDKGYISKQYIRKWITETYEEKWTQRAQSIRVGLLCAFTFLNVLIPVTLAKYSSWLGTVFKPSLTRSHQLITSVYWGMAIAFGAFNLSYLLESLHKYNRNDPLVTACILPVAYPCQIPSGTRLYNDLVTALLLRMILLPITLVVELLIAACTPKPPFPVPCCHFASVRGMEFLPKVIHTIALWNIFVFIQIVLGLMIIPICILLFVSPTIVIALTTMFLFIVLYIISTLVALQYFFRQLYYRRCTPIRRCSMSLFGLVGTLAGFGLVFVLALLYYTFTLYGGAHNNGITGVFLSLLPSIVISLVGWFIKKKLHNNATRDATNVWREQVAMGHNYLLSDSEGESDEEMLPL